MSGDKKCGKTNPHYNRSIFAKNSLNVAKIIFNICLTVFPFIYENKFNS